VLYQTRSGRAARHLGKNVWAIKMSKLFRETFEYRNEDGTDPSGDPWFDIIPVEPTKTEAAMLRALNAEYGLPPNLNGPPWDEHDQRIIQLLRDFRGE
jgi:hypothetical protein